MQTAFVHPSAWPARWANLLNQWLDQGAVALRMLLCSTSNTLPLVPARDEADVRDSLRGDGQAYARLVERYQQTVGQMMWRFTRNRANWEELVHDVFVEAYFSLGGFQGKAPFEHWLRRIATRTGYRFWKTRQRRRREQPLDSETTEQAVADKPAPADAADLVHHLLGELAPRDRLVLTLSYLEGRTTAEIADLTGWTHSLVKVQSHRARRRLAKICSEQGITL
jgi:RNA polymerase sigma-70 factor (ECF subfamily)